MKEIRMGFDLKSIAMLIEIVANRKSRWQDWILRPIEAVLFRIEHMVKQNYRLNRNDSGKDPEGNGK